MKRVLPLWTLLVVLILSVFLTDVVAAQTADRLSVTGQIRQRTEYSAKDFNADIDDPLFSFLRTRVNVGVRANDDVKAFVQFQDSRVWGQENSTLDGNAPLFDVHQAFFTVNNVFDSGFNAKVGRQEINVGNQRLVGAVGWHNVGRTFDAARFMYEAEKGSLDIFAARLVGSTGTPDGDNLFGAAGTYPLADGQRVEALVLFDNSTFPVAAGPDVDENMLSRVTAGVAAYGKESGFDYELEAYYQMGDAFDGGTGELGSIAAYLASAKVGYLVDEEKGMRVGGLFTIVSGDDDAGDGDINNFNTLFASNHKFYGFMDYFIGAGSFARGLQDIGLSFGMKANDQTSVSLDLHNFTAPQAPSGFDNALGQEIDFTVNHKYNSALTLVAGLSAFMPGDDFGGEDTAFWGYLSSIVNF